MGFNFLGKPANIGVETMPAAVMEFWGDLVRETLMFIHNVINDYGCGNLLGARSEKFHA